jgi:hypothetical protein
MEPDPHATQDRVLLLAQIALEGVTLSDEVQAAAGNGVLGAILDAARRRSAQGLPPLQYVTRKKGQTKYVYPAYGALPFLPLLDTYTT